MGNNESANRVSEYGIQSSTALFRNIAKEVAEDFCCLFEDNAAGKQLRVRLVKELIDSGVVGAAPKFGALLLQYAITLVIKHAFRQAYILIEQLIEGEHAKNEKEDKPKTADFSEAVRKYLEDSIRAIKANISCLGSIEQHCEAIRDFIRAHFFKRHFKKKILLNVEEERLGMLLALARIGQVGYTIRKGVDYALAEQKKQAWSVRVLYRYPSHQATGPLPVMAQQLPARLSPHGANHLFLQVGPRVIHWTDNSVFECVLVTRYADRYAAVLEPAERDNPAVSVTDLEDAIEMVIDWNRTKEYSAVRANCQQAIGGLLESLKFDRDWISRASGPCARLREKLKLGHITTERYTLKDPAGALYEIDTTEKGLAQFADAIQAWKKATKSSSTKEWDDFKQELVCAQRVLSFHLVDSPQKAMQLECDELREEPHPSLVLVRSAMFGPLPMVGDKVKIKTLVPYQGKCYGIEDKERAGFERIFDVTTTTPFVLRGSRRHPVELLESCYGMSKGKKALIGIGIALGVGGACVAAAPVVIPLLGFGAGGIAAGSAAATTMSVLGSGSTVVAALQSAGAVGMSAGLGASIFGLGVAAAAIPSAAIAASIRTASTTNLNVSDYIDTTHSDSDDDSDQDGSFNDFDLAEPSAPDYLPDQLVAAPSAPLGPSLPSSNQYASHVSIEAPIQTMTASAPLEEPLPAQLLPHSISIQDFFRLWRVCQFEDKPNALGKTLSRAKSFNIFKSLGEKTLCGPKLVDEMMKDGDAWHSVLLNESNMTYLHVALQTANSAALAVFAEHPLLPTLVTAQTTTGVTPASLACQMIRLAIAVRAPVWQVVVDLCLFPILVAAISSEASDTLQLLYASGLVQRQQMEDLLYSLISNDSFYELWSIANSNDAYSWPE